MGGRAQGGARGRGGGRVRRWAGAGALLALVGALGGGALLRRPRAALPEHLLGHPFVVTPDLLTPEQAGRLLALGKRLGSFPTNVNASVVVGVRHEHIGEAAPRAPNGECEHPLMVPSRGNASECVLAGRIDIARHFLMHGGVEGFKEGYRIGSSRLQSFMAMWFTEDFEPVMHELFESERFAGAARKICPADSQHLDPLQFNIIVNVPGQTVALHLDSVHFWGANRFQFPEWLLAAMTFSGLWRDRFIPQVQTVAYFHNWTESSEDARPEAKEGHFVLYESNGPPRRLPPRPRSGLSVDGSKVVHAAATYFPKREAPFIDKSKSNELQWDPEREKWDLLTDGERRASYLDSDLRFSLVFRARCFPDAEEAARYRSQTESELLSLDTVLSVFREDLRRRGRLTAEEEAADDRLLLALRILDTYVRYPLPPDAILPYNICLAPLLLPTSLRVPAARALRLLLRC